MKDYKKTIKLKAGSIFRLLVVLCAFFCSSLRGEPIAQTIAGIPEEDKTWLSMYFQELILNDSFGYTIFGGKPLSFTVYSQDPFKDTDDPSTMILAEGEKLWNKYAGSFDLKNFTFKFQTSATSSKKEIFLINRKAVLDAAVKHLHIFQEVLGENITPENLLCELERADRTIQETLQYDEGLFGLLLGFGYDNALAYKKRKDVACQIQKLCLHPIVLPAGEESFLDDNMLFLLGQKSRPSTAQGSDDPATALARSIDEFSSLQKKLQGFNEESDDLVFAPLPNFMAIRNCSETENLSELYKCTQQKLASIYSQGSFLEVTLCQLTQDQ